MPQSGNSTLAWQRGAGRPSAASALRRSTVPGNPLLAAAALASITHGACSVWLVALINQALTTGADERSALIATFALVALCVMLSQMASSILFERLSQQAHAHLRRYVSGRVLAADYRHLEALGAARVQSALSEHCTNVAAFFVTFPAILTNLVVVLGSLLYMLLLSWKVFIFAVLTLALGSLGYHLANLRAIRHLNRAAVEQDTLFAHFRSLTDGAKELRLHRGKRKVFADQVLGGAIEAVRRERTLGMSIFSVSASFANFLIFAFIGLVMFVLIGGVPDEARVMTGFALVFVYMVTPLEILLLNIPRANLARASATRIDEIAAGMPETEGAAAGGVSSGGRASGNQVARLAASTAIEISGMLTRLPRSMSKDASISRTLRWCDIRRCPRPVGTQGTPRTISKRPLLSSSALMRCDTADWLMPSALAAFSKLPWLATASSTASAL
eukprot:gene37530-46301_t